MLTVINAISHFLVDAACVCALFSSGAEAGLVTAAVMLYDTLAFSTQCVVGLALDSFVGIKRGKNDIIKVYDEQETATKIHGYLESLAMIIVAAGALIPCGIVIKAVIIGLGNSLFHVTGGVVTLKNSGGKAAPLGIFVAPGAFGVTLGTLYPSAVKWVAAVLVITAVVCFMAYKRGCGTWPAMRYKEAQKHCGTSTAIRSEDAQELCSAAESGYTVNHAGDTVKIAQNGEKPLFPDQPEIIERSPETVERSNIILPVILLTAAVAVRAIGGCAVSFTWKDGAADAVFLTLFVFLGKALGGFVCDRFGAGKMSAVTITLAAVLTAFFAFSMPLSLAGQFLLNLSMPVTLWLLYRYLPDYPGLAFGLAASALWPGTIAGWLIKLTGPLQSVLILICFIFGLGAIIYAERSFREVLK